MPIGLAITILFTRVPTMPDRSIRRRLASIKRQRIAAKKIVNLSEFRLASTDDATKKLALVGADDHGREKIQEILERQGFQVLVAGDAIELSCILESSQLDFIVMRVDLPWIDGFELCDLLKSHSTLGVLPVFLLPPEGGTCDIDEAKKAGATHCFNSPVTEDQLVAAIDAVFFPPPEKLS